MYISKQQPILPFDTSQEQLLIDNSNEPPGTTFRSKSGTGFKSLSKVGEVGIDWVLIKPFMKCTYKIQMTSSCPWKYRKLQIQCFSLVLWCTFGGNIWTDSCNIFMQKHFGITMENCYWYHYSDMDLYLNISTRSFVVSFLRKGSLYKSISVFVHPEIVNL